MAATDIALNSSLATRASPTQSTSATGPAEPYVPTPDAQLEPSTASAASAVDLGEDEWEYEYHEDEFEEFYVTLDLSAVATSAAVVETGNKDKAPKSKAQHDARRSTENTPGNDTEPTEAQPKSKKQLQILELHSENPIVAYNGKVLSCRWASALGTDLHFANVVDAFEMGVTPVRPGTQFDLLGASSARLVATGIDLKPRKETDELDTEQALIDVAPGRMGHDPAKQSQARFLNRLDRIKRRRGDKDRIPFSAFRPTGEFAEKYRTLYTASAVEVTDIDKTEERFATPVDGNDKSKPPRRRAQRSDQSLWGDNSRIRSTFLEELRRQTPMKRTSFYPTVLKAARPAPETGPSAINTGSIDEGMKQSNTNRHAPIDHDDDDYDETSDDDDGDTDDDSESGDSSDSESNVDLDEDADDSEGQGSSDGDTEMGDTRP